MGWPAALAYSSTSVVKCCAGSDAMANFISALSGFFLSASIFLTSCFQQKISDNDKMTTMWLFGFYEHIICESVNARWQQHVTAARRNNEQEMEAQWVSPTKASSEVPHLLPQVPEQAICGRAQSLVWSMNFDRNDPQSSDPILGRRKFERGSQIKKESLCPSRCLTASHSYQNESKPVWF